MQDISKIVMEHKQNLKPGEPQLNYCDQAVMVSRATSDKSLWSLSSL